MRNAIQILVLVFFFSCGKDPKAIQEKTVQPPKVEVGGRKIFFPNDAQMLSFLAFDTVRTSAVEAEVSAPATVAITTTASATNGNYTVLFDKPELEEVYSQFLQHLINIKTYKVNLIRLQDLLKHGAASGKEVLEAQTQLDNEEAALAQQEGLLIIAGLDPEKLKKPSAKEAILLCEIPEIQAGTIKRGDSCSITFTAFPDQRYKATVDGIGSEVDNVTRMHKVRVVLPNASSKLQVGMFAQVQFKVFSKQAIAVPVSAVVNVEGKDYVFVRCGKTSFERREFLTGFQSEDKVVVLNGLKPGEVVAVKGVMQLKGLSFGY